MLVARSHFPYSVMRESEVARGATALGGVSPCMVRNLYMVKTRPFRPIRWWEKIAGPGLVARIRSAHHSISEPASRLWLQSDLHIFVRF